jgi:hypothetical protein
MPTTLTVRLNSQELVESSSSCDSTSEAKLALTAAAAAAVALSVQSAVTIGNPRVACEVLFDGVKAITEVPSTLAWHAVVLKLSSCETLRSLSLLTHGVFEAL